MTKKKIYKIIESVLNFNARESFKVNDLRAVYIKNFGSIYTQNVYRYLNDLEKLELIKIKSYRPLTYYFDGKQKTKLNQILKNEI